MQGRRKTAFFIVNVMRKEHDCLAPMDRCFRTEGELGLAEDLESRRDQTAPSLRTPVTVGPNNLLAAYDQPMDCYPQLCRRFSGQES